MRWFSLMMTSFLVALTFCFIHEESCAQIKEDRREVEIESPVENGLYKNHDSYFYACGSLKSGSAPTNVSGYVVGPAPTSRVTPGETIQQPTQGNLHWKIKFPGLANGNGYSMFASTVTAGGDTEEDNVLSFNVNNDSEDAIDSYEACPNSHEKKDEDKQAKNDPGKKQVKKELLRRSRQTFSYTPLEILTPQRGTTHHATNRLIASGNIPPAAVGPMRGILFPKNGSAVIVGATHINGPNWRISFPIPDNIYEHYVLDVHNADLTFKSKVQVKIDNLRP